MRGGILGTKDKGERAVEEEEEKRARIEAEKIKE